MFVRVWHNVWLHLVHVVSLNLFGHALHTCKQFFHEIVFLISLSYFFCSFHVAGVEFSSHAYSIQYVGFFKEIFRFAWNLYAFGPNRFSANSLIFLFSSSNMTNIPMANLFVSAWEYARRVNKLEPIYNKWVFVCLYDNHLDESIDRWSEFTYRLFSNRVPEHLCLLQICW